MQERDSSNSVLFKFESFIQRVEPESENRGSKTFSNSSQERETSNESIERLNPMEQIDSKVTKISPFEGLPDDLQSPGPTNPFGILKPKTIASMYISDSVSYSNISDSGESGKLIEVYAHSESSKGHSSNSAINLRRRPPRGLNILVERERDSEYDSNDSEEMFFKEYYGNLDYPEEDRIFVNGIEDALSDEELGEILRLEGLLEKRGFRVLDFRSKLCDLLKRKPRNLIIKRDFDQIFGYVNSNETFVFKEILFRIFGL